MNCAQVTECSTNKRENAYSIWGTRIFQTCYLRFCTHHCPSCSFIDDANLAEGQIKMYERRLQSSWTHFITPSGNFVEVQRQSLFRNTSLGKRCTSYNATPTSRKRAADRWSHPNFFPRCSYFIVGKAQKSHGTRYGLYNVCSNGVTQIHFWQAKHRIQFTSHPMTFLGIYNHEKGGPRREIPRWSTIFRKFTRSGWSVAGSVSLAKRDTSKKRPSPHLQKVQTRSKKVSPWTLQAALVLFLGHCA
jgi:hypothetical protein